MTVTHTKTEIVQSYSHDSNEEPISYLHQFVAAQDQITRGTSWTSTVGISLADNNASATSDAVSEQQKYLVSHTQQRGYSSMCRHSL